MFYFYMRFKDNFSCLNFKIDFYSLSYKDWGFSYNSDDFEFFELLKTEMFFYELLWFFPASEPITEKFFCPLG
jgi:hypothetical protein